MKSLAHHPFFTSPRARLEASEEERLNLEVSWLLPLSVEQARRVLAAAEKRDYEAVQAAGLWSLGRANLAAYLCASGEDFLDVLVSDLSATDLSRLSKDLVSLYPEEKARFTPERLERPLMWLLQSYAESAEQLLHDLNDLPTRLTELQALRKEAKPLAQLFLDTMLAKFDSETEAKVAESKTAKAKETGVKEAGVKEAGVKETGGKGKEVKAIGAKGTETKGAEVKAVAEKPKSDEKSSAHGRSAGTETAPSQQAEASLSGSGGSASATKAESAPRQGSGTQVAGGATGSRVGATGGNVGATGATRATGGDTGATGSRVGATGAKGATGATGGNVGATGAKGATGATGGDTGATGAIGATGGDTGATRATGGNTGATAGGIRIVPASARKKTGLERFDELMSRKGDRVPIGSYVKKGTTALVKSSGKVAHKSAEQVKSVVPEKKPQTAEQSEQNKLEGIVKGKKIAAETIAKKGATTFRDQVRKQRDSLAARAAETKEQREKERTLREKEQAERKAALELETLARREAEEEAAQLAEKERKMNPRAIRVPSAEELRQERRAALSETASAEATMELPPADEKTPSEGKAAKKFAPARTPTSKAKRSFAPPTAPRRVAKGKAQTPAPPVEEATEIIKTQEKIPASPPPPPVLPPARPVTPSVVKANPTLVRQAGRTRSASRGWQVAGLLAFVSTAPESLFKGGKLIPSAVPIVLLVVAILLLWDSRARRSAPPPVESAPVASEVAFAFATQPGGPEDQPQIGVGNLLSLNEVRYCLYQEQRLQLIREHVNPHSQYETTRYNHEVDDYNQRCLEFRHPQGAVRTVRQEIPEWQDTLAQQAETTIQGWRNSSASQ